MRSSALAAGLRRLRGKLAAQQCSDDSDEHLLHAFTSRRDDSAFAVLVRRHGPMVLHICRRVLGHEQDAEDAFQATFLVLARSASALRNKASLASFLHGIAYRTAMKAKQSAGRRRKHEGRAPARPSVDPADELSWREVRALLDEEIARLPEKYRIVFVFFHLEELSREEIGRRLELKEATVAKRLAEARKRLSQRLARRGVELTAVLTAATLAAQQASALPAGLMATTINAALATRAGAGLASVVSASVAELVKGMTASMMLSKTKIATLIVFAVTLLGGASAWAYRSFAANVLLQSEQSAEPPVAKGNEPPRTNSSKRDTTKSVEIHGRVFAPDGKPKAGAKLLLLGPDKKIVELGVTAADGRFSLWIPKEAMDRSLMAQAEDTGFGTLERGSLNTGEAVELHLVKDQPIRGRVVNTEGKPVAGVRVAANDVSIFPDNSLDRFLNYWKNLRIGQNPLTGWGPHNAADVLFATTTDAEGRFVLRGIGVERFVPLRISGAGIAEDKLWIVTRPGFDPKAFNKAVLDNSPKDTGSSFRPLHGPDLTVVAEPEKILRGVVKEAETGKGRPNVLVHLFQSGDPNFQTRTDSKGRFEIRNARKARSYRLEVESDPATGYVACGIQADDTPGYQPLDADITVKKGVIVSGRMIDQATRKPVKGSLMVAVLSDNPFVKEYPGFATAAWGSTVATDTNGVFRVVAIPGPVLLLGRPRFTTSEFKYKPSEVEPKYSRYFRAQANFLAFCPPGGGFSPILTTYFKVLEIKPDAKVVEQDVVLERWPALTVQIEDGDGQPLTHVYVTGLTGEGHYPTWDDKSRCSAYGIRPDKPRVMVFYHQKRKLAAALTLKGDEKQPVVVKLGPAAALKGRLLDSDGKPLAGVRIDLHYHHLNADAMHRCTHEETQIVTDANGTFTHDEVIPGFKFGLSFRRGRQRFEREIKPADATIQVKPGECCDVGVLKLK